MPDHLTPAAEALLADILAVHRIVGRLNDAAKDMWREKVAYAQSEARATAPLLAERDALRAALEDIADRYVSDNNNRPAGFATWAGERALAALTPQAPAASGERCGFGACNRPRESHAPFATHGGMPYITGHPFQPAEPDGGAA